MTPEEIENTVEAIVNEQIAGLACEVHTDIMGVEEAKKSGAMALFGEKYGQTVYVWYPWAISPKNSAAVPT